MPNCPDTIRINLYKMPYKLDCTLENHHDLHFRFCLFRFYKDFVCCLQGLPASVFFLSCIFLNVIFSHSVDMFSLYCIYCAMCSFRNYLRFASVYYWKRCHCFILSLLQFSYSSRLTRFCILRGIFFQSYDFIFDVLVPIAANIASKNFNI